MKKTKSKFVKVRYLIYLIFFIGFGLFFLLLVQPVFFSINKLNNQINLSEEDLRSHVSYLVGFENQRVYKNLDVLNQVGDYIYDYFEESGCDRVSFQTYDVKGEEYRNVICYFEGNSDERVVVGAHYDVFGEYSGEVKQVFGTYAGADDNASAVAGLLELSRLVGLNKQKLKNNIEFVAYTLEEPPFFDSEKMGSFVHAKSLYDKKEKIKYMLCLEMIGYFSDEEIQEYPVRFLNRIYPSKGNFIAIVGEFFDFEIKKLKKKMIKNSDIDVWSVSAPSFVPGIDFSDHRNYWNFGYKAYMITDTSFFRNKNYHTAGDTIETLDFSKMKEVVKGVYGVLMD